MLWGLPCLTHVPAPLLLLCYSQPVVLPQGPALEIQNPPGTQGAQRAWKLCPTTGWCQQHQARSLISKHTVTEV